ncbi:MAG: FtsQ-type POTRA domain-containing protein [Deltaproteobacteria bacterium]|nr:FtsQ-type POTRA domain-containing protein [Deltaproteobacteria bacterium]
MNGILGQQEVRRRSRGVLFRRYRLLFKRAGFLACLIGSGYGLWWGLTHASTFALRQIEVVGRLEKVTMQEIVEAAGLHAGVNLFSLNLQGVEAKTLRLPWIRSVSIRRQVPATLWIHVTEQKPKALLLDDQLFFVSEEGLVFKRLEGETNRDLPVITGMKGDQSLKIPLQLIDLFEEQHDLGVFGLSEIHYNAATGYSVVTLKGPLEVKLGRVDFEKKLERLKKIWADLAVRTPGLRGIDLNYDEKAIVKL